jgi:NAD(P)H-hydrate epimerase
LVIGPGLGRADATSEAVRRVVASAPLPVVVDGDGLVALAWSAEGPMAVLRGRQSSTVLTPHDGEFALLRGAKVGPDRIGATRTLARDLGCVVMLKGPSTVVADPRGRVLLITSGDDRLATAGTGDVLSGIVGALLSMQVPAFEAAASAAWIHGRAGAHGPRSGLIASDLPALVPLAMAELRS